MNKALISLLVLLFSVNVFSQEDPEKEYEVFDVIYTKEHGAIKGEILSFDEATGGIVFKDRQGNTYSFGREDYTHFKENQSFEIKKKKEFVLKERKSDEFAFEAGFSTAMLSFTGHFESSDYVLGGTTEYYEGPLCLKVVGGKYIDDKNFAGATFEYGMSVSGISYSSGGLRYKHYYDAQKKNLGLYVPVELKFTSLSGIEQYSVNDTAFTSFGYEYPAYEDVKLNYTALTLELGPGISFIVADKKYLSLELGLVTQFGIKEEYDTETEFVPDRTFTGSGLKGSILFGF